MLKYAKGGPRNAERPGDFSTTYVRPVFGCAWRTCPITGLEFPETEGIMWKGKLVHPLGVDEPGYKETIIKTAPEYSKSTPVTPNPDIGEF